MAHVEFDCKITSVRYPKALEITEGRAGQVFELGGGPVFQRVRLLTLSRNPDKGGDFFLRKAARLERISKRTPSARCK